MFSRCGFLLFLGLVFGSRLAFVYFFRNVESLDPDVIPITVEKHRNVTKQIVVSNFERTRKKTRKTGATWTVVCGEKAFSEFPAYLNALSTHVWNLDRQFRSERIERFAAKGKPDLLVFTCDTDRLTRMITGKGACCIFPIMFWTVNYSSNYFN